MHKQFLEKNIGELKNIIFEIPEYQRGYRWEKNQVNKLLEDIYEYFKRKDEDKNRCYYLQPIIVKNTIANKYDLVDGQQRLTTLYMILTYIDKEEVYQIQYKTIKESDDQSDNLNLKNTILEYIKEDSRENQKFNSLNEYYYYFAIETIKEWFKNNFLNNKDDFREFIINNVKILWYELDSNDGEDENDTFIRINTNKISLTQADLVKAEFLRKDKERNLEGISLEEITTEWDEIEKSLFNPSFWFFINNVDTDDRMTKILEITIKAEYSEIYNEILKRNLYNENIIYDTYENILKQKKIKEVWNTIKQTYYILNEWYEDIELYNFIGYIVLIQKNREELCEWIVKTIKEYKKYINKKIFKTKYLIEENIKKNLFVQQDKKETNKELDIEGIESKLRDLNYNENKNEIKNILILHNILTLNLLHENKIKFAFDKYKNSYNEKNEKIEWDIEHIHSQHDKQLEDEEDKISYINYLQIYWTNEVLKGKMDMQTAEQKIDEVKKNSSSLAKLNRYKRREVINSNSESENQISNLVLLDASTNRSYKDDLFMKKRRTIIEKDEIKFIPICTKKAFLKEFIVDDNNQDIMQFFEWNSEDEKMYLHDIATKIYEGIYNKKEK